VESTLGHKNSFVQGPLHDSVVYTYFGMRFTQHDYHQAREIYILNSHIAVIYQYPCWLVT